MFWKKFNPTWSRIALVGILGAGVLVSALAFPRPAQAHCDSEKGPVATAAQQALDTGNVKLILPYVKPESEAELTAAFKQALNVRKTGGDARLLADQYFKEVAVRLHRTGEGASFTGLTDEQTPPAIHAADKAMETGSMEELYKMLDGAIQKGVAEKYHAVVEARAEAARLNSVEAQRERVEAELTFEKYIYGIYTTVTAEQVHSEGAEAH